jgi:hypothetical protein
VSLIRCIRCRRQWDRYGYERIPSFYKSWKDWEAVKGLHASSPEFGQSKTITLHAEELSPALAEFIIKQNNTDKVNADMLRLCAKNNPEGFKMAVVK